MGGKAHRSCPTRGRETVRASGCRSPRVRRDTPQVDTRARTLRPRHWCRLPPLTRAAHRKDRAYVSVAACGVC